MFLESLSTVIISNLERTRNFRERNTDIERTANHTRNKTCMLLTHMCLKKSTHFKNVLVTKKRTRCKISPLLKLYLNASCFFQFGTITI